MLTILYKVYRYIRIQQKDNKHVYGMINTKLERTLLLGEKTEKGTWRQQL